jgi:mono/diheme cytochrome c family protein
MPSFKDNLTTDEAWDLVHYLRTMQVGVKVQAVVKK